MWLPESPDFNGGEFLREAHRRTEKHHGHFTRNFVRQNSFVGTIRTSECRSAEFAEVAGIPFRVRSGKPDSVSYTTPKTRAGFEATNDRPPSQMQSSSTPRNSTGSVRVDTDHHLHEMMQRAVGRLQQASVQVQLSRDSVLLTGSVNSWHEKQFAQEAIRVLSRTRRIHNELQVRSTRPPAPA